VGTVKEGAVVKKAIMCLMAAIMLATSVGPALAVNDQRGGVMGFIAGCCFGIRSGAAYNDGKEVHWREWILIVPLVGFVCSIWNGIDGMNGMTSKDYASKYGAMYY